MAKSKRKVQIERRRKANEKKILMYALGITLVLLIIIFFVFKSMI